MDDVLKTVFILHLDGTPVLRVDFGQSKEETHDTFMELFGGFSSAINVLIKELGHKELKSISVGDGILVYSSREPLLFVVHAEDPKNEQLAKLLVKQIEHDFIESYEDLLLNENVFVFSNIFAPFKPKVVEAYDRLMRLHADYPQLLEFLPSFVPVMRLYDVLNVGLNIIEGYPDETIQVVRQLNRFFADEEGLEEVVSQTLGKYSGHRLAQERFRKGLVINQDNVLKLLNEISVTKFDKNSEVYDIVLCPVCRGKTAKTPICHFFNGFIEGALNNPKITVEEISCRALGDKSCRFKLHRD